MMNHARLARDHVAPTIIAGKVNWLAYAEPSCCMVKYPYMNKPNPMIVMIAG